MINASALRLRVFNRLKLDKLEINPEEFSNEIDEKKKKLEKLENYEKLLKAKDEMIWSLVLEKKKLALNDTNQSLIHDNYKKETEKLKQ